MAKAKVAKKAAAKKAWDTKKLLPKKAAKKKGTHGGPFLRPTRSIVEGTRRPAKRVTRKGATFTPGLVFAGMSFTMRGSSALFDAIQKACKGLKLRARRVDQNVGSGMIILEIIDLIEAAEFVVFDLTDERPNVYYELGYAHGVGNDPANTLLIAKRGTKLHFDISPLRVVFYRTNAEAGRLVRKNLREMLKVARPPATPSGALSTGRRRR